MAQLLTPDLGQSQRFLDALEPAGIFTFQTFTDKKDAPKAPGQILHGTLEQHADQLANSQQHGAGVFVMVNEGNGVGRKSADVIRVRAHFVDLDGAPIEPVTASNAPPHILVESSPGKWHAYWRVEDATVDDFKSRQHILADQFSGDRSVCDLPRVMRLPGFWHLKSVPFQTRLVTPTVNEKTP